MPEDNFKTEEELDTHIVLHQLKDAIINMSKEYSSSTEAWREEARILRKDMDSIAEQLKQIGTVQIQLAEIIANQKNGEKSVDAAWDQIRDIQKDVASLKKMFTETCDISSRNVTAEARQYTDQTVDSLRNWIIVAAIVASVLGGTTWYNLKDDFTYHVRDKEIHHLHNDEKDKK